MPGAAHILLIEDDASLAANLCDVLKEEGFQITVCSRGDEGLRRAGNGECEVVLTDLRLPGLGGLELVRQLHDTQPRLPVVLMTAHGTIETAIEATKLGAYDYLQKPFEMPELISVLHRAVDAGRLMCEPVTLPDAPVESRTALVGISRAMHEVCKEIGRVAAKPVTVLIRGETGTGKELIARAIYQHSPRAKAPFIAINCAAIPENLLESELFGHERGAFTGADQRRIGRFEQANKGTLFLDEIGDLPPNTQVKLLRVLQQQTFQRVGGAEAISVDVRVIAATHRNLEAMIREGKFREDLFHRLNVVSLQLPPLRERREDIPVLVRHFLRKYAADFGIESPTISSDAVAVLQADSRPGNVRELENITRRLLLAARGLSINADAVRQTLLPPAMPNQPRRATPSASSPVICWRARRRASCRTLMPACPPKPNAKSSRKPLCWQKAIKRKPHAGWDCPDSPCAKSSNNLVCIRAPPTPTRKRTAKSPAGRGLESALLTHADKPLPFKPGARFALCPNAVEAPILPLRRLRDGQGGAQVACPRYSRQTALGLDPDWQGFVHVWFDGIRKLRLR